MRHDAAVDFNAEVDPIPHQVTIVVSRVCRVAITSIALVIAAPGAEITDSAGGATSIGSIQALGEEITQFCLLNAAVAYVPKRRHVRACEAVT